MGSIRERQKATIKSLVAKPAKRAKKKNSVKKPAKKKAPKKALKKPVKKPAKKKPTLTKKGAKKKPPKKDSSCGQAGGGSPQSAGSSDNPPAIFDDLPGGQWDAGVDGTGKLTLKQQLYLCSLLAAGYNASAAAQILEDVFNVRISRQNVHSSYLQNPSWKKRIRRMRTMFDRHVMRHPLMDKVNRLNIILAGINECFTWRLDKRDKYGTIYKRNLGPLTGLVERARVEAEGEKALVDQSKHMTQIFLPSQGNVDDWQDPDGITEGGADANNRMAPTA